MVHDGHCEAIDTSNSLIVMVSRSLLQFPVCVPSYTMHYPVHFQCRLIVLYSSCVTYFNWQLSTPIFKKLLTRLQSVYIVTLHFYYFYWKPQAPNSIPAHKLSNYSGRGGMPPDLLSLHTTQLTISHTDIKSGLHRLWFNILQTCNCNTSYCQTIRSSSLQSVSVLQSP